MIKDEERREVARKLREAASYYESMERDVDFYPVESAIGLKPAGETAYAPESVRSLADLIEPSGHECVPGECPLNVRHDNDRIDRDALLKLERDIMDDASDIGKLQLGIYGACYLSGIAKRIREALGVVEQ